MNRFVKRAGRAVAHFRARHPRGRSAAIAALLALNLAAAALAEGAAEDVLVFRPDPAASSISFTLKATMHTVEGSLQLLRGELRFDPATGAVAGEIVADARSAETGNARRDRKMHREVLESDRFPEIILRPVRLAGRWPPEVGGELSLEGSLELHGESHEVSLPATVILEGGRLRARVELTVPYVEWGLEDPSAFVLRVAKEVRVTVDVEGPLVSPEGDAP